MGYDLYTLPKDKSLFPGMEHKVKVHSFSIPTDLSSDFNAFCKKNGLNKSQVVTKLIEVYLQNAGVREK